MASRRFESSRRAIRHRRVRKKVEGTQARPRLSVFRSNKQIYAQLIDDSAGRTIVAASSLEMGDAGTKSGEADAVGQALAKKAAAAGIKQVVFDRGGYKYHGRLKSLADGARAGGLEF